MKLIFCAIAVSAMFLFSACDTIDVFEKTAPIPQHKWSSSDSLNFEFTSKDSLSHYNLFLVLRHTEAYHFSNIWIDFSYITPDNNRRTQRINLALANANGWYGSAMDDIIEERVPLFSLPMRLDSGLYKFTVRQVMREDPLENVLNAGIRVEKTVR